MLLLILFIVFMALALVGNYPPANFAYGGWFLWLAVLMLFLKGEGVRFF